LRYAVSVDSRLEERQAAAETQNWKAHEGKALLKTFQTTYLFLQQWIPVQFAIEMEVSISGSENDRIPTRQQRKRLG
jgi:hypothetical protein